MSRGAFRYAGLACLALACPIVAPVWADEAEEIGKVRAAVEKFRDVNVALASGYIPDPAGHCVTAEMAGFPAEYGAMGIHYLHPQLLQITGTTPKVNGTSTYTDWSQPSILIYEPQADGSLELVAVENLVFEQSWLEAGNNDPPEFAGRIWDYMSDDPNTQGDEAHGFMPHYDQHVWVMRENPSGNLEPFNPAVNCEHHTHAEVAQ